MQPELVAILLMLAALGVFGFSAFNYQLSLFQLIILALLLVIAVVALRMACAPRRLQGLLVLFFSIALAESVLLYVLFGLTSPVIISGIISIAGLLFSLSKRGRLLSSAPKLPGKSEELRRQLGSADSGQTKLTAIGRKRRLRKRYAGGRFFAARKPSAKRAGKKAAKRKTR